MGVCPRRSCSRGAQRAITPIYSSSRCSRAVHLSSPESRRSCSTCRLFSRCFTRVAKVRGLVRMDSAGLEGTVNAFCLQRVDHLRLARFARCRSCEDVYSSGRVSCCPCSCSQVGCLSHELPSSQRTSASPIYCQRW